MAVRRSGLVLWHGNISCTHYKWRHNVRNGVSNHQPCLCLRNCLFRLKSKKTPKLRVSGLLREFTGDRASNAENVSFWWCHHVLALCDGVHRSPLQEKQWSEVLIVSLVLASAGCWTDIRVACDLRRLNAHHARGITVMHLNLSCAVNFIYN